MFYQFIIKYHIFSLVLSCGRPPYVPESITHGSNFTFGQTVEYFCPLGYKPHGIGTRVCLLSGNWSKGHFRCEGMQAN